MMHPETQSLTETELDYLYQFCRKHYIRYYDVQVELVDHLANATEALMLERPELSFTAAVDTVYAGFDKTGFRKIIAAKEEALEQQHKLYYRNTFRSYFTTSRILMMLCAFALIWSLHRFTEGHTVLRASVLLGVAGTALLYEIGLPIFLHYAYKRPKQELISRQVHRPYYYYLTIFCYPELKFVLNYFWDHERYLYLADHYFILIGLFCMLGVLLQLVHQEVSKKIYRKAFEDYPLAYA
ncbi:hypothetical protein [Edaphocola aurantiacus]|uniref:hypothetical protein n=1 Tax=Edaphocola aurantiacus TaxID=2601682 RepID=UPI001C958F4B|nr:hypothetical protein [Edaphocola aurantiacus]